MAKIRGLQRRGRTYYSRIVVPVALVPRFGRREILKSLRTTDRSEATALHLKEAAHWAAAFAEAERKFQTDDEPASKGIGFTDAEVAALAKRFFERRRVDLDLKARGPADPAEERTAAAEDLQWELSVLQSWDNPDAHRLVQEAETEALQASGRGARVEGEAAQLLAELLRRALVQLGALELARLHGDYLDRLQDSFFMAGAAQSSPRELDRPKGPTLGECIDRYQAEVLDLRSSTEKTRLKQRAFLKQIGEHFGRATPLPSINRADCNRFRDILAKLPPNFSKAPGNPSIAKIGDANRSGRTLAWETQSAYLKTLSDLFEWAKRERLISDNVAEKIAPLTARQHAEEQRLPFKGDELQALFRLPLFTGSVDDERRFNRAGPNLIRRSRYWLPLLGLFTGMRMGEIAQLTPDHIRMSPKGSPFIALTRDMKLKTGNAEREVPIHPQLLELGFVEWVQARREAGAELLFEEVPKSRHGYASDTFSKRFATVLRSVELATERKPKLCFHSLRHTFKDALNETGATEEQKDEICGWSRTKVTGRRYGSGLSADQLKPVIEAVSFDVDFGALVDAHRKQAEQGGDVAERAIAAVD